MIINLIYYIISFITIWFGAGLIIKSIDRLARKLKLSSFTVSFFLLGILTSIPEIAISFNAVADNNPEIFVGTLLGGTIVIFLFIIPLLAIFGKGIRLNHNLDNNNILIALVVISAPGLLVIDRKVTNPEGLFLVILYLALFIIIHKKHGIFDRNPAEILTMKAYSFMDLAKVGAGVALVFISSQFIVAQTIEFSRILHIPTFYLSLILLSVGTNLPEISLAIRAILSGKKDVAFGDYLGSASVNTLLFGFFTLINDGEVLTANNFLITYLFILTGLGLFYYFSKSKRDISVSEGFILLSVYILFVVFELSRGLAFR